MITLAIAEDHQALVDGIKLLLSYQEDIQIVGVANDGERLLEIVRESQPNVVLTDIKMPKTDGITATKQIKKHFPEVQVIAFSMFHQVGAVSEMIAAGARGYILKNSPLEEVLHAIRAVHQGKTYFDANLHVPDSASAPSTDEKPLLSKSEREILKLIGEGKSSSEIAAIRFTAISTVEKHRKNMIQKLGLSGKGELLRYAVEQKYNFE
ncbi:MAG: DNA-binding response regulator [Flavobacteriaceae bacterium]|nr:DNA-binding response regulator [Flavobacteriaceae bacterium]